MIRFLMVVAFAAVLFGSTEAYAAPPARCTSAGCPAAGPVARTVTAPVVHAVGRARALAWRPGNTKLHGRPFSRCRGRG